ncbi:MAG TPA: protein-disulfide reductase DsbD [Campylobacterales bacterium]|nr:protein-disulfide reductase DsbD [Campylobacterales bacterium]
MKRYILVIMIFLQTSIFAFTPAGFNDNIIEPEDAFIATVTKEEDSLKVLIKLAKDIYLYHDKISVEVIEPVKKRVDIKLPVAKDFHDTKVYFDELKFKIPFSLLPEGRIKLRVYYQGCSKAGLCYAPMHKDFIFDIKSSNKIKKDEVFSQEQKIADTLKNESLWIILITFFGFGLLLALTPCVFPMIPILSSIIIGTKNITTKKAFFYSLIYVLAMALTYTIAGILAGIFGSNLQAAFQNPWIISIFALIFVALAFSMFGFYEIGLPASLQTKLTKKSEEAKSKGGIIGVAIMGFLSALIVGPCVAPPLAGALIYIGQTGDALLGGLALFSLSMGMGLPLILIGTGAGKFMPKPGIWMNAVSKVFGVVMLAVAIWMIDRVVPPIVTLLLYSFLLIGSAVYLRAFENIKKGDFWLEYLKKTVGIILFIYGLFLFFGAFSGATNPLDPLESLKNKNSAKEISKEIFFKKIYSLKELETILKESKKPVLLDFYATWCVSCKELEHNTFLDFKVIKELKDFTLVQADVTSNSKENKELLKHFSIFGPPAILFFKGSKELREYRVIGYKGPDEFLEILKRVKEKL